MSKHDLYFNNDCERMNHSIYKTKVDGKYYIIKDLDLEDESIFYGAIREVSVLFALNHPNIIKMFDYFIEDNTLFIVQPYIENSLYDLIKKHKKENTWFTNEQIYKILSGLLEAIYYLHQNNITHRDLKPENILIMEDFTPILIDFGQAKKLLFKNTTQISTCYYRAPEVLGFYEKRFTNNYDKKIDVWGVGTILFEMVTKEQLAKLPEDYETSEDSEKSENSETKSNKEDDDNSVFGSDSESSERRESESEESDASEEHDEDNVFIIHDIFRKLGMPSKHVLDTYNLRKFLPEETLPDNPLDFLKEQIKDDEKLLHFLLNTLSYDPAKRYTIKQCIESSYINKSLPEIKMIVQKELIQLNNAKLNMGLFQKNFQTMIKKLKPEGVKEESLFKARRLALYFMGIYKKKIPNDWLIRLIGVCIYICDNLISSGDNGIEFYVDLLECSKGKFFTILREVMIKTIHELFII